MTLTMEKSDIGNFLGAYRSLSLGHIIFFAISLLFVRWVIKGLYRVYFHPLSRFPGPKSSAFTRVPYLYAHGTGTLHKHIAKLHDQYGDVVRVQPDELSFVDARAWRDIYGYGSKEGLGSAPPKFFDRYGKSSNGVQSLITTRDPAEHGRVRRIFSPAFSDRALTQQEPLFMKYVDQLVQTLKDSTGDETKSATFDIVRMYNFTTFDVMGDLTFGESLHMLDNADYDPWVRLMFDAIKKAQVVSMINAFYPLAARVLNVFLKKLFMKKREQHFNHSATRVTKRLERGRASKGVDIWDLVLGQEEKGKEGLSRGQMDINASTFMIAGTETTATLLSGLTYFLLTNPQAMKTLVAEIRDAFATDADISMEAIARLPYLNGCIKEGLRRYPPVPSGLPHRTPANGSTICGHFVPPDTTVAAHHLAVYTSPKLFKDPLSFVPERWTGDERYATDERSALQPFSTGPRDCLGKNMAYHEMRLILTKVLYNFDLELCPESQGWLEQEVYVLWQKRPLMVKVKVADASCM